ncbi:MAG: glycerophosphodiester phosphodiesterase family protein [Acidimicrobiia bacterium]|nr:glycerophosphodiester phosphodiesterase family protein [Acidimicrobiia bacterium]
MDGANLDIQGHRGARGLRPENTLPSFEVALDLGVTTLELDLHLSADDRVVIWHDPVIDPAKCRLGAGAPAGLPDPETAEASELAIRSLTAEQLAGYSCDRNPDANRFPEQRSDPAALAGSSYGIITLTELFSFVEAYSNSELKTSDQRQGAAEVGFNIETKRVPASPGTIGDDFDGLNPGLFERRVADDVNGAGVGARVTVQSFDHRSLRAIHAYDPDLRLVALTGDPVRDPGQYADWGATVWSPRASTVTEAALQAAHAAGLLVIPWTVNDPDEMAALVSLGVDGLITDRPDLALSEP